MPDHTAPEPAEPATEPAHPKPAATARTVAAGILFAALGAGTAASVVLVITAVRLLGSGDGRLDLGGPPTVLLAVAFGAMNVAALLFLTRDWAPPRAVTAMLAFVVAMAWPLSGIPLPAAALAIVAIGLALGRDRRVGGGRRVAGWGPFGVVGVAGLVLAIAGAAIAESHPVKPPRPSASAQKAPAGGVASGDVAPPSEVAPSQPAAGATPDAAATGEAPAGEAPAAVTGEAPADAAVEAPIEPADEAPVETAGEAPVEAAGEVAGEAPTEAAGEAPIEAAGEAPTEAAGEAPADAALPDAESESAGLAEAPAGSLDDAVPAAESFVREYYRALDEKRFEDAWDSLTPSLHTRFGGFGGWKAGYAKTLYSKPRNIIVTATGDGATVKHLLVARDTNCSGERRFSVTWRLRRVSEQWSVTALTAAAVGANTSKCR